MDTKLKNTLVLGALGLVVARSRSLRLIAPMLPFAVAVYDLLEGRREAGVDALRARPPADHDAPSGVRVATEIIEGELVEPVVPAASSKRRAVDVAPKSKRRRKSRSTPARK